MSKYSSEPFGAMASTTRACKYKQVAKVSKLEAVVGLPKFRKVEKNVCGPCQMGKQIKLAHPKVNVVAT